MNSDDDVRQKTGSTHGMCDVSTTVDKYGIELLIDRSTITDIAESDDYVAIGSSNDEVAIHSKDSGAEIIKLYEASAPVRFVFFLSGGRIGYIDDTDRMYIHDVGGEWPLINSKTPNKDVRE